MINIKSNKNQKINEIRLVQTLFYTFPLWFIVGNLAVSINTLLFIFTSLFLIKKKQLTFRFNNLNWLLIIFFSYFFLSTTINFLSPGILNDKLETLLLENNPIFKSFMLIRFVILIIIIDTLFFNKILNFKKLFLSSLLCTSFVSFDIILQYITGYDLFRFKSTHTWNSGPFGDELIAGTYLKNFSFFSFFYIFTTFKNKNFNFPLLIFIIVLHFIAILLAGNRMPLLLFLFGCVLIILLIKNLRFAMSLGLLISLLISFSLIKNDTLLNSNYVNFFKQIVYTAYLQKRDFKVTAVDIMTETSVSYRDGSKVESPNRMQGFIKDRTYLLHSGYRRIYNTAISLWQEQPLFGFGLKSFRVKCWDMLRKDNIERKLIQKPGKLIRTQKIACSNHAHNYYLEFLSETGIIGISLLVIFFLILLKDSFNYLKKYNQQKSPEMALLIPVIIIFFLEIWPLKSTGSFFTTWGATFFWLNTAMLIAAKAKKSP